MGSEIHSVALAVGYVVLILATLAGLALTFVGATYSTDWLLRSCGYSVDFWREVRAALIRRWMVKFKKEARDDA